jgi:hypothetical protein
MTIHCCNWQASSVNVSTPNYGHMHTSGFANTLEDALRRVLNRRDTLVSRSSRLILYWHLTIHMSALNLAHLHLFPRHCLSITLRVGAPWSRTVMKPLFGRQTDFASKLDSKLRILYPKALEQPHINCYAGHFSPLMPSRLIRD